MCAVNSGAGTPPIPQEFAASGAGPSFSEDRTAVFSTLSDGNPCVYTGMRAAPVQRPVRADGIAHAERRRALRA
jgi:hypothetical protein